MFRGIDHYYPYIKARLDYFGLSDLEIIHLVDTAGYELRMYYKTHLSHQDMVANKNPVSEIDDKVNVLMKNISNSRYISDLRAEQEKEIQTLKEKIEELEKQNMALSEAFTNGSEYLGQLILEDEEKKKTDKAYDELVRRV